MKHALVITLLAYLVVKELPQVEYHYDMSRTVAIIDSPVYQLETINQYAN